VDQKAFVKITAFMRKKIVAGNWKMNLVSEQAIELVKDIQNGLAYERGDVEVIVFPPAVFIRDVSQHSGKVHVGAQNFFPQESGAYLSLIHI
jgi:triosephosphate isomerase